MSTQLGKQLRDRRKLLGLNQQELADISGCGIAFIVALERGKPTVRLDKVEAVADALGLKLRLVDRND